ncbi:MAG: NTP transferase domain-containing protein, partial [Alistipes sp.]|nr:NTP transferase domain-containing protein [Alistipes sp.]
MQAIILAAGMGRRLGALTNNNTKCMLEVNGIKLIDRTLDILDELNIRRVILVVGYNAQNVVDHVGDKYKGMEITYVENSVYDKTNNIYSLFLAREHLLEDDTLLLESDLIFESDVVRKIIEDSDPNIALVD